MAAGLKLEGLQPLVVLSGDVVKVMVLCVLQATRLLRWVRELLTRAEEALRGQSCAWSCLVQDRSRGRTVPGKMFL